jgi:hypothetical protein
MRQFSVFLFAAFILSACDIAFGPPPTETPTPAHAELAASPTFDIRPPTDLPNDVPLGVDGMNNPTAAAVAAHSDLSSNMPTLDASRRPVLITLPLPSGVQLDGELWTGAASAPAILLLGGTFESWGGYPATLRDSGYSVVTIQGDTGGDPAANLKAMFDVMALQPGIDPARMLAIGAGLGADAALIGCASDSRCLGAVLLSPQNAANLEAAMIDYNPRPVLLTASQEDSASLRAAERVRQSATGSALLQPFEGAGHGVQILFNRPDMIDLIRDFLNTVTGR